MRCNTYPYSRSDECSWQPEEAARRLGALAPAGSSHHPTRLLTRGRSDAEVRALRGAYGRNTLHDGRRDPADRDDDGDGGDDDDDDDDDLRGGRRRRQKSFFKCAAGVVATVLRAFCDQLREPLILMLLFSAGVSLCLGNAADAVSIGMALAIVSMVAAIQEYRSERGEWCVPVRRAVKCGCVVLRCASARGRRAVARGVERRGVSREEGRGERGEVARFFAISPPSGHECHSLHLVVLVIVVVAVVVLMNPSFGIRRHQQITKSPLTLVLTPSRAFHPIAVSVGRRIVVAFPGYATRKP